MHRDVLAYWSLILYDLNAFHTCGVKGFKQQLQQEQNTSAVFSLP